MYLPYKDSDETNERNDRNNIPSNRVLCLPVEDPSLLVVQISASALRAQQHTIFYRYINKFMAHLVISLSACAFTITAGCWFGGDTPYQNKGWLNNPVPMRDGAYSLHYGAALAGSLCGFHSIRFPGS